MQTHIHPSLRVSPQRQGAFQSGGNPSLRGGRSLPDEAIPPRRLGLLRQAMLRIAERLATTGQFLRRRRSLLPKQFHYHERRSHQKTLLKKKEQRFLFFYG